MKNLYIIGEAARQLPVEVREQISEIEWRKISGFRNVLAHVYFGIDDDIVWSIIQSNVPELTTAVRDYLKR